MTEYDDYATPVEWYCPACRCTHTEDVQAVPAPDGYFGVDAHICEYALSLWYNECHECGELVHRYDTYGVNGYGYCSSCYYDVTVECYNCGERVHENDTVYDVHNSRYYCESCSDEMSRVVRGYHECDKTACMFGHPAPWYTGCELEVDKQGYDGNHDATAERVQSLFESHAVYFEHDGSLHNGFEVITAPYSLAYLREHESTIRSACGILQSAGYRSHNTTTCGLHFHISWSALGTMTDDRDEATARLLLLSERFEDTLIHLSRRSHFSYCEPLDKGSADTLRKAKAEVEKQKRYGERYRPWNLTNYRTIEYRLSRGTLHADTLLASWYITLAMVRAAALMTDADADECRDFRAWLSFADFELPPVVFEYLRRKDV